MLLPDIYTVNLFLHLVAVSLWLGLTLNYSLLIVPLLRDLPEDLAEEHLETIGKRARRMVLFLMVLLIGTGLVNLHQVGLLNFSGAWGTDYGITVGLKVGLAMFLFLGFPVVIVLVVRYGSDDLDDRITRMDYLHWAISGITLVIMFLGVMLRT